MEGRWCSARRPGPPYRTRFLDNPRYACFACSAQCTEICKCSSLLQMYFTVAVLKSSGSASTKQSRFGDGLLSWDGESHLGAHELMAMAHNDTGLLQHARLLTLVASLLCLVQVISFGSHSMMQTMSNCLAHISTTFCNASKCHIPCLVQIISLGCCITLADCEQVPCRCQQSVLSTH